MPQTAQQIINDIESHFKNLTGPKNFSDLYIGITKSIEERLFGAHNVQKDSQRRIFRQAINENHARAAEEYFLNKGMKGGAGGGSGDGSAIYVYCYEITTFTNE